ncbi:MAG: RNA 2',3'-cyclic phosphodiesterase [Actinomycetota bacterium]|nr:RNA 2',3'-cyclic phosphodiesterase [Actinomycetota bacterium]
MRTFVAIYPPLETRETLLRAARDLLPEDVFRWTSPANVHLTLKFLGDTAEESLPALRETLDVVCNRHEQFEIEPRGIGAFPSARKARIVWAGVGQGSASLLALAEDLEDSVAPLGFEKERRGFKPHITLGRARRRPGRLPEGTQTVKAPGFAARQIELVESSPGKDGVAYSTLSAHPLLRRPSEIDRE